MAMLIRSLGLLLALLGGLGPCLEAQHPDPFFEKTGFAQWASQAPREQIPWKLRVFSGGLTAYQRIAGRCFIDADGGYFKHRTGSGPIVAMIQVTDSDGRIYQDHSVESPASNLSVAKNGISFYWPVFMLPGDYQVALALYDPSNGEYSFDRRSLRIDPLNKDPLPDAWHGLPRVELLRAQSENLDSFFRPEAVGKLRLPLSGRRPLRIEILANLTGTGLALVSEHAYRINLISLLPIVKTFSQLEIREGSLNVEFFDIARRRVAFAQDKASSLDWPRLKEAVIVADPGAIDVHALGDPEPASAFLRGEVARRLAQGPGPSEALPVLVLISSSSIFDKVGDMNDTLLPGDCQCAVYYIHYNPIGLRLRANTGDFDNLAKVLKPLRVRSHVARSPEDLRRIMAQMIDEISQM